MSESNLPAETSSFFLYSGKEGKVPVECRVEGETIWLSQKQLSELFDVGIPAINKHLKNIFETGELEEKATISKMEIVRKEGSREVTRQIVYYNLCHHRRWVSGQQLPSYPIPHLGYGDS